jgi:hypothetical protein
MHKTLIILAALAASLALPAVAQKPDVTGGTVVASEPGKAAAVRAVKLTAQVVAIDQASRTVTLKGPKGNVVDVVAGDEVKNFDQIKVGDQIKAAYVEALTLELKKTKKKLDMKTETDAVRAAPGQTPGGAVGRQITALCDVVAVDPKKSTITLKGPRGNVMELNVRNPDHFKVVKKGDQVEVVYTEAVAMTLAPVAAGTKK